MFVTGLGRVIVESVQHHAEERPFFPYHAVSEKGEEVEDAGWREEAPPVGHQQPRHLRAGLGAVVAADKFIVQVIGVPECERNRTASRREVFERHPAEARHCNGSQNLHSWPLPWRI